MTHVAVALLLASAAVLTSCVAPMSNMTMAPYWKDPHDLIAGECFLEDRYGYAPSPGLVESVSCDLMDWDYVVTNRIRLEDAELPDGSKIETRAVESCDPLWSELLIPDQGRWDAGNHSFACIAPRDAFR